MAHRNVGYFFMCYLRFYEYSEIGAKRSEKAAKLERKYAYMRKIGKF